MIEKKSGIARYTVGYKLVNVMNDITFEFNDIKYVKNLYGFYPTNKIVLTFIQKKLKKLETENVRMQFKTNQNILKMLSCLENVIINKQ